MKLDSDFFFNSDALCYVSMYISGLFIDPVATNVLYLCTQKPEVMT